VITAEATWAVNILDTLRGLAAIYPASCPYLVPETAALDEIDALAAEPIFAGMPRSLAWSLAAFSIIGATEPDELAVHELRWRSLRTKGGVGFTVLASDLPRVIWNRLPLPSHEYDRDALDTATLLSGPLDHLERHYAFLMPVLQSVSANIMVCRLLPEWFGSDYRITSSSFPVLPGTIFLSRKAFHHIPPSTVAPLPSIRLCAENILHESIHQTVNLAILTRSILREDYSSKSSPKVEISWRMNQDVIRNRHWEIDRVLHAATVYVAANHFRVAELTTRDDGSHEVLHLRAALRDGCAALDFLSTALLHHLDQLDDEGVCFVRALRSDAEQVLEAARPLVAELAA
jgi:hypothetical protein